jgi:hypothetical protein
VFELLLVDGCQSLTHAALKFPAITSTGKKRDQDLGRIHLPDSGSVGEVTKLSVVLPVVVPVLSGLTRLGFISPDLVARIQTWKHTGVNGFNVDWGRSILPKNRAERESLCQYLLRNPFSEAKVTLEHPKTP